MRPTTEGCSEQSCMYHGLDNREKAQHGEDCPIRKYRYQLEVYPTGELVDACTCGRKEATRT